MSEAVQNRRKSSNHGIENQNWPEVSEARGGYSQLKESRPLGTRILQAHPDQFVELFPFLS